MGTNIQAKPISTVGPRSTPVEATSDSKSLSIWLSLLAVYFIWGSTYLAIRIALGGFPPFLLAGIRFVIAGSLMYTFLRLRGTPNPTRKEWSGAAIVGLLLLLGGNGLVTFAEQWVASGLAALVVATVPIFAALFAGIWGRWPTRREWLGLGIGFVGVALLSLDGGMSSNSLGAAALLLATISWAFGSVWSRYLYGAAICPCPGARWAAPPSCWREVSGCRCSASALGSKSPRFQARARCSRWPT
jgi:drug/metabolite transporter (DMT)-like permease